MHREKENVLSNIFDLFPPKMAANNFLRKLPTRWRKPTAAGGIWQGMCAREAKRGEVRRSEAKEAALDTRAFLGHWLPVAADLRVSKDSRSDAHDVSFSAPLSPSLSFCVLLSSSILASFSPPLLPPLRLDPHSFLLLLKSAVSVICLNSESKRGIFYSPVSANRQLIRLLSMFPVRRSYSSLIIFANLENYNASVFFSDSVFRQYWHVWRRACVCILFHIFRLSKQRNIPYVSKQLIIKIILRKIHTSL